MRIISGQWKGKRLTAPKNLPTRPTTDFAKEALFNVLNHRFYLDEVNVLDLFAGIGGITFEFASHGAEKIHSIEQFGKCTAFIKNTSQELELNQIEVYKQDVFQFLNKEYHEKYDIIFADPPFDLPKDEYEKLITLIFKNQFLDLGGMFILEHPKEQDFSSHPNFIEYKKYGNIYFSFFESESSDEEE